MNTTKKITIPFIGITCLVCIACCAPQKKNDGAEKQPVDLVNPYMGNISHLLVPTFPTIHLPNSLLRVYPERRDYTGVRLNGLPLVITSHRGSSAFNLSPFQGGESELEPVISFSYDQEQLTPYSYSVYLDEQQIGVDFGLSHQSAAYDLQFDRNEPVWLVLNSRRGSLTWDGKAVSGYQLIENDTRVYLYLVPEVLPEEVSVLKGGVVTEGTGTEGRNACLLLKYPLGTRAIGVKYGISFIDEAQASENMEREVAGKTVAQLQSAGRDIWNEALGKIKISGGTD